MRPALPARRPYVEARATVPTVGSVSRTNLAVSKDVTVVLDAADRTFATGLLPDLIAACRACGRGNLLRVRGKDAALGAELDCWCRLTRNGLIGTTVEDGASIWTIRCGEPPADYASEHRVGSRLWLYANFDCNLSCDYCCVRSSPRAARRALGLDRFCRIAAEAGELGVGEFYVTGGEPFLVPDIAESVTACAAIAPTTLLTNGMLFKGRRLDALRAMAGRDVTLQISLDSPSPALHDFHRGAGSWAKAWTGIGIARAEGFRVRIAASVATDAEEDAFRRFLDDEHVEERDRVIRRIALRGAAGEGVPLSRADLVPEVTITAEGVFWHPVGAEDDDLLVTREIFPLADAFAAVESAFERERRDHLRLASIFNCA